MDSHARKDDRATPNPNIFPDKNRLSRSDVLAPQSWIPRVIRCKNLHTRTDYRVSPDVDGRGIEDNAVEVQERSLTDVEIEPRIAEERHPDIHSLADKSETLDEQAVPLFSRKSRSIVACGPIAGRLPRFPHGAHLWTPPLGGNALRF